MGVLREYHHEIGGLILEHEGTLERFTGDGMMIFFNDPVEVPTRPSAPSAWRWQCGTRGHPCRGLAQARMGTRARRRHRAGYATIGAIGFEGRWD